MILCYTIYERVVIMIENELEKDEIKKQPEPNEKQQECIYNTKLGKYLVIAGPGTGKTFTVTRKIKHMIEDEGVEPEKILCLTFSNTAAREMKTKIGEKYDVNVFTYHEFCLNIMEEFSEQFDIGNANIISDSHKRNLIKECIDELKPVAYNNEKNNPYQYSQDILDGIEEIKKYRMTKDEFFTNLKENPMWEKHLTQILNDQADNPTKKRKDEIESLTDRIAQMKELWKFYELYTQKMRELNYIDFHDMINMVLEKFEDKDSSLLEEIAYKYEYILVDEYQDTNKAQNDIVFALSEFCPNIFVVGDDDQIIYTFQGANLDTIENFLDNFKNEVKVVCLTENNRSTQTVLDISQELAELQNKFSTFRAEKAKTKREKELYEANPIDLRICSKPKFADLNITKNLISPETSKVFNKNKPVEYYSFEDSSDELEFVVQKIKDIINSENRPDKLSEIAILARTNEDLKEYETLLKINGIKVEITGGKNIFDINAVNMLITYMQFLVNPEFYSDKLLSYLLSQPFHIDPRDYKTLYSYKSHHKSLTENILNLLDKGLSEEDLKIRIENILKSNSNSITDDIKNLLETKSKTIYNEEKLRDFIETYEYLKNYITNENYANSIYEIGCKTGIFQYYLNDKINRVENIKGVKKLLDEANAYFAIHKDRENSFSQFVDYLTKMLDGGIKINLDKEEKPLDAVQLSTYHSSKGREFEYVFMPFLTNKKWESSSSSYKDKIPMATDLSTFEELEEKQAQCKFLDNIKLLYVGMTRAKHSLYLSYVDTGSKDSKPSWFIRQLKDKFQESPELLTSPEKPEIQGLEKMTTDYDYKKEFEEFIRNRFQKSYSPSSLNKYRKCPREYFYNYILGLKSSSGNRDNLTYGNAVHKAFQFTLDYAMNNKKYPTADEVYEVFAKSIDEQPCSNPENLKQSGKEHIFANGKYYDKFISIAPVETLETRAELPLDYTTEDGINFIGSIDRIDKNSDGTYSIYDYKTGTDNSGITKSGQHSDYFYQIGFYKYLFKKQIKEKYGIDADVSTTFIYPLLTEEFHTLKDMPYDVCEEIATEFVEIVNKIHNLEFDRPYKCPNDKFCDYKNLCKMNVI